MKKILLILIVFVGFLNTNSQTYFSADLESGIDNWTIIDSDGDGNNWSVNDFDDNEGSVLNSASYDNNTGPLTPDNWIITPAINLASSNAPTLYWKAKAQDQLWADENYSVYVSTQSDVNALSSSSVSFSEVIGTSNGYELRTLDLSSFNNETVYVAFRHHDVSDMYSFNVKDISVSEVLQEFVQHDISSSNYQVVDAEGGTGTFDFTVTSFGTDNLIDYDFNYTINGSTSSIASNQTLSAGDQESFSFDLGIGEYTIVTSVSNSNGEVVGEEQEFSLFVVQPVPNFTLEDIYGNSHDLHEALSEGKTVVLDFFPSWCYPCELSMPEVNSVWNQFGAGDEDFEVYGLTTETTDDAAVISGLGWGAEYPIFEYSYEAYLQYFHYASSLETSGFPLYVIVCPNTQNPGFSEVSWFSEGWTPGGQSQNEMIDALQECNETIFGCTDTTSINYNPEAYTEGSSVCYYQGCMDVLADNYNPIANQDDGSCISSTSCGTNLFISEYVQGSSNNRAIELYNPTNETIDLSNYALSRWSNGGQIPETTVLEGSFAPGESFVIGIDKRYPDGESLDAPLWDGWNLFIDSITGLLDSIYIPEDDLMGRVDLFINPYYPGTMYFNGNDAVTLETSSGDILDIIGKIGEDPGNGWSDASGEIWTNNKTLIRKASVTAGFVYDPTQPYSFDPSLEWDSLPANTFSNLGIHSINCDDTSQNGTTVVDVIVNSPNHTTLAAAVGAAGLVETLSGDGPFTVFAPTDAAFAILPEGLVATLLEDPSGQLTTILTHHVYDGSVLSTDLYDAMILPTNEGSELEVAIDSTGVYIDNAMVIEADIVTSNGVVHVIDALLLPVQGELTACPYPYYFEYDSNYTIADISMCITYIIEGCTNSLAENYNPEANLEDGSCVIIGCMSEDAYNYNAAATIQGESCILYGCTNETAENYNDQVTDDDGSCIIYGCILEIFPNYNPEATVDDLSCNPNGMELYGCIDPIALNFNSQFNIDNGSCIYHESPEDCVSQIQEESIPLYLPGGWTIFGYTCIEPKDAILGFNNITEQIIIVKDSEGNAYIPEFGFNGIGDLIYSRGYQIKTNQEITDFSFCPTLLITENTPQREVGDLAEGGIVFYVDETGEHGLVAALEDLTEGATDPYGYDFNGFEWGCFFENVSGADGQAKGTGYQNTMDIVSQGCVTENGGITAAQVALDTEVNGYSDWYLPSIDELNEMYNTIGPVGLESNIGGFEISVNSYYWSSSEINHMTAWGVYFDNGDVELSSKNNTRSVRVIRSF